MCIVPFSIIYVPVNKMNVDLATSFMNASRIGIFWFYTLQGLYPSSSPTASGVTTNQFNLSSYWGWIVESIFPTMGIPRAISSEGKISCTLRSKSWKFPEFQELEKFIYVRFQNKSTGLKYELDSLVNTNCHSWVTELSYQFTPLKFSHETNLIISLGEIQVESIQQSKLARVPG